MSSPTAPSRPCRRTTLAVVPAAGLGTRLRPLTSTIPKEMLPIGREPVLAHVVRELRIAGIERVLFVISDTKPQIRAYFGESFVGEDDDLPPIECSYAIQHEQRGLGHAISLASGWAGDNAFAVAFGDTIIDSKADIAPLARLIDLHAATGSQASTLVEEVPWELVSRYGIVSPRPQQPDNEFSLELDDIVEKPTVDSAPSRLAVSARWVLDPVVFDFLSKEERDARGEINLTDAVRLMKRAGGALWAACMMPGEQRQDIGNFGTFYRAFIRAAMQDAEYGPRVIETIRTELAERDRTVGKRP